MENVTAFCNPAKIFKPAICRLACVYKKPKLTRSTMKQASFLLCTALLLAGCDRTGTHQSAPPLHSSEAFPAGQASTSTSPFPSFEKPVANLPEELKTDFYTGKALAEQPWVKAPTTTTARDGLGPIYNARTCMTCHVKGGKGKVPLQPDRELFTAFVRISVPGNNPYLGVQPEPVYGDQLQTQSVSLAHQLRHTGQNNFRKNDVPPEAYVYIQWVESTFTYPSGETLPLRRPELNIQNLGYGDLHPNTLFSLRNASSIGGMGLLESIPEQAIRNLADPEDKNQDGISGKPNIVWDNKRAQPALGRFGHKANRPNLDVVVAAAFAGDVGISNPLFPQQPCTAKQTLCVGQPTGNDKEGVELPQPLLDLVTLFSRNLGMPKRTVLQKEDPLLAEREKGRELFYSLGCASCHNPSFTTGEQQHNDLAHLSNQIIWPYTDLLLHDMGSGLADNRPDFLATGSEWRTAPLWGIGLLKSINGNAELLHDGRARTIEEAIVWHGGEAEKTKQAFAHLAKLQREQLITFVESL